MKPQTASRNPITLTDLITSIKFLLLALALTITALGLGITHLLSPVNPGSNTLFEFEIIRGWGAHYTSERLEAAGLIRNARLFSIVLRLRNLDTRLGEGLYQLHPGLSAHQIGTLLVAGGKPRTIDVLLPEGLRGKEVAKVLATSGLGTEKEFFSLINEPRELRRPYIPKASGLEGFLFPASYEIPVTSTTIEVLDILLERFAQEIPNEISELLAERGLSIGDWVILASLVQSEAGHDDEMPIIAGVFLNRLDNTMALQSDPTVAYGLNKQLPELDISAGDFERDHGWNTYTRPGLPSGPISNPGRAALRAVLDPQRFNPEGDPYLYFLHGFNGNQLVFRPNVNLSDHNRDRHTFLHP
jgi:UPF0755 protein